MPIAPTLIHLDVRMYLLRTKVPEEPLSFFNGALNWLKDILFTKGTNENAQGSKDDKKKGKKEKQGKGSKGQDKSML